MTREVFIVQVEREQEALRGFLLALCCGKKDDADDLAQDALVKAYLSCAGYQDKGKFRSWIFKIAYNTFLNHKASLRCTWQSGYNTCLFDLTPYLTKRAFKGEPQRLSMHVYSRFKGYEFDCFDDWATMGIFRDVTLMAVPKTHLSDLTVTTRMDGTVIVTPQIANATRQTSFCYELTDAEGRVVSSGEPVKQPHLWTAETPYLYTLRAFVREKDRTLQTFTHKIGIREISIAGNALKVNGRPVKLRGVNAHSTDPQTVKVISDELTFTFARWNLSSSKCEGSLKRTGNFLGYAP